jgi:hypothetical protein
MDRDNKMRKIKALYEKFLRIQAQLHSTSQSPKAKKSPSKELNKYQKFYKTESAKIKHKNTTPKSMMRSIAKEWNIKKNLPI